MILPFIATALLLLVTAYSALVSFRPRPANAAPTWIFPRSAGRTAQIIITVLMLALIIGPIVWIKATAHQTAATESRFVIPENYSGWVHVEFEVHGSPRLPVENGQNVLKISSTGSLKTSSPEPHGLDHATYFYESPSGPRQLPSYGRDRTIWGKLHAQASGPSTEKKYAEFFVGTEQQYQNQSAPKRK